MKLVRTGRAGSGCLHSQRSSRQYSSLPQRRSDAATRRNAQGIVDNARVTLGGFMKDKDYAWLHQNIKKAKGVLIYPQVLKAGFILGGSGGTGVLLTRDSKTGEWKRPRFLHVGR